MIDREKVIRAVDSCFDYWLDKHRCLRPLELEDVRQLKADAIALLKEQPEIVRCNECAQKDTCYFYTPPNWFCADGKRKEDS